MAPSDCFDIFLAGDVMTGRGVDQVLPNPGKPRLHEPWVRDARTYVKLAEEANGPIPAPLDYADIWGEALAELDRRQPDLRLINLETAVTTSDDWQRGKGIHYRMHPANAPVLGAAGLDVCSLANNHVLDWGRNGLRETLASLDDAGIARVGAGTTISEARAPAVIERRGARCLVFAAGGPDCGIPGDWAAGAETAGVHLLPEITEEAASRLSRRILEIRQPGDIVILSIHWGGNWGYHVSDSWRRFARRLIDLGAVDLVHGHSSHHPLGLEVYRERLILYGCGDLISDYEGIGDHEEFRPDLGLLYFPRLDRETRKLAALEMVPVRRRHFRLQRAEQEEARWLQQRLDRECRPFGSRIDLDEEGFLRPGRP